MHKWFYFSTGCARRRRTRPWLANFAASRAKPEPITTSTFQLVNRVRWENYFLLYLYATPAHLLKVKSEVDCGFKWHSSFCHCLLALKMKIVFFYFLLEIFAMLLRNSQKQNFWIQMGSSRINFLVHFTSNCSYCVLLKVSQAKQMHKKFFWEQVWLGLRKQAFRMIMKCSTIPNDV